MDQREMLIRLWHHLRVPDETIAACAKDYDLLCPHCKVAGRGVVHLKVLPDNTGFECTAIGHKFRAFRSEVNPYLSRASGGFSAATA